MSISSLFYTLLSVLEVLLVVVTSLMVVAFITLAERKTMASMQRRIGPNFVGFYGLLQAFADALKLILKEYVSPTQANFLLFFLGPIITLIFSLFGYAIIPYGLIGYNFNFIYCFIFYIISCKLYSCNLLYNFYLNNSSDNKAISFRKNLHYNNTNLNKLKMSDSEFNQWLTGFSDASPKSVVVWGSNLQSLVGTGKFTKQVSNMIVLAPYQYSVVIGLLLSDGWLIFASKTNKNARLGFKQSLSHSVYILFVFNILSHYCSSGPKLTTGVRAGKWYYGLEFYTRSLTCITELYLIFYPNKVKIIPDNIYELLTPVALIMGDGSVQRHGLILCTDSYSIEDVVRLMNVLMIRYRLECTLRFYKKNQYRIYIRQDSMSILRTIVTPYFHSSMLYKITSMSYKKSK